VHPVDLLYKYIQDVWSGKGRKNDSNFTPIKNYIICVHEHTFQTFLKNTFHEFNTSKTNTNHAEPYVCMCK
jgi:hypothetical protein